MSDSPRRWSFLVAGTIFALDFVTKRIVLANQEWFERGIPLIDGLLRFTYVRNAGAAFGLNLDVLKLTNGMGRRWCPR